MEASMGARRDCTSWTGDQAKTQQVRGEALLLESEWREGGESQGEREREREREREIAWKEGERESVCV